MGDQDAPLRRVTESIMVRKRDREVQRRGRLSSLSSLLFVSLPSSFDPFLPFCRAVSSFLSQSLPFSDHLHPLHPEERKNKSNVPHPCVRIDFFSLVHQVCPPPLPLLPPPPSLPYQFVTPTTYNECGPGEGAAMPLDLLNPTRHVIVLTCSIGFWSHCAAPQQC